MVLSCYGLLVSVSLTRFPTSVILLLATQTELSPLVVSPLFGSSNRLNILNGSVHG